MPNPIPRANLPSSVRDERWKELNDDPVAGRLLKQLYGTGSLKINYPKTLRQSPGPSSGSFHPVNGSIHSRDPREKHIKPSSNIKVPRVGRGDAHQREPPARIEYAVMRRRPKSVIEAELQENEHRLSHYRPAHTRAVSTEQEKDRLAEKFEFGGGKALPKEMVNAASGIPSEVKAREQEALRIQRVRRKRQGLPEEDPAVGDTAPLTLYEQVLTEVEERQQYLHEARAMGGPVPGEERIKSEISSRMAELKQIEQREQQRQQI